METKKYIRKPFIIEAVRVTAENMADVAQWCGGEVRYHKGDKTIENAFIKVRVYRALSARQTQAFVGDWVLYAGKGYKVYTDKAFENSFAEHQEEDGTIRLEVDPVVN